MQTTIDGKYPAFEIWCRGYGSVPAYYMFVGISAGRLGAIKTQVPFTKGPSGRLLQRCLRRLGLSLSDEFSIKPKLVNCYLTNFVKGVCLTDEGLNRLPTSEEFAHWWPHLYDEFGTVNPERIIAVGNLVHQQLAHYAGATSLFLKVVQVPHPRSYASHGALSNNEAFEQMVSQYRKALEII